MREHLQPTEDVLKRIQLLINELKKPMQKSSSCDNCKTEKSRCPVATGFMSAVETDCPVPFFQRGWFCYMSEKYGN